MKIFFLYPDDSFNVLDQKFLLPYEEKRKCKPKDDFNPFGQKAVHDPVIFSKEKVSYGFKKLLNMYIVENCLYLRL